MGVSEYDHPVIICRHVLGPLNRRHVETPYICLGVAALAFVPIPHPEVHSENSENSEAERM